MRVGSRLPTTPGRRVNGIRALRKGHVFDPRERSHPSIPPHSAQLRTSSSPQASSAVNVDAPAVLDPVENISKNSSAQPTEEAEDWGKGKHRRAYLAQATNGLWGEPWGYCGLETIVKATPAGLRISPVLCDRWGCGLCGRRRAAWLKRQIAEAKDEYRLNWFWTLTLRADDNPPVTSFIRIKAAWNSLRTSIRQKNPGFAYVWTVEPTKRGTAHLHLLTNMEIGKTEVRRRWRKVTGGSFIVDIQPATSSAAANYIAKYSVQSATIRQRPEWAILKSTRVFSKSHEVKFDPYRTKAETSGAVWPVPYWHAHRLLSDRAPPDTDYREGTPLAVFPLPGELVAGVPAVIRGAVKEMDDAEGIEEAESCAPGALLRAHLQGWRV